MEKCEEKQPNGVCVCFFFEGELGQVFCGMIDARCIDKPSTNQKQMRSGST